VEEEEKDKLYNIKECKCMTIIITRLVNRIYIEREGLEMIIIKRKKKKDTLRLENFWVGYVYNRNKKYI